MAAGQKLPHELQNALVDSGLPQSSVSLWVAEAGNSTPIVSLNAKKSMQPASVIKVVTTAAALDLLRPNFCWNTDITAKARPDKRGAVASVTVRGTGDPHLMVERVWLMAQRLRTLGVKKIEGNIRLDRSAFDVEKIDQGAFDGAPTRTYNVGSDALMVNLKTVTLTLTPIPGTNTARVRVLPELEGIRFPATVRTSKGKCGDWKTKLKVRFGSDGRVRFAGRYPAACSEQMWHMAQWGDDEYFTRMFKKALKREGIVWKGKAVPGKANEGDILIMREYSEPLNQIVAWTNKFSSNPMARQIFLTLSSDGRALDPEQKAGSLSASREVVADWLAHKVGINPEDIYLDNGSGLSRQARVTAESLGRVLSYAFRSSIMPEFMASLPAAGIDGTMRKRKLHAGSAHVKTGFLKDVRSIAGYATDADGRRYTVVVLVNDEHPDAARAFSQAVLNWAADGCGTQTTTNEAKNETIQGSVISVREFIQ